MKKCLIVLEVWMLLGVVLPAHAATLAWTFTPGDVQQYRLTQSSRLSGGLQVEGKLVASVEQVLDLTWQVLEVDDSGDAKVSLEVTAFSLLAKGPDGQEVRFDGESADEPQGYAAMLSPIGKRLAESPILFSMNSQGEVTGVQLPEDLSDAIKSVPGGKKFAQDGGLTSFETLARLGAPLDPPKGGITANQTWSAVRKAEIPAVGATEVNFEYTVVDPVSENEITVEQRMSLLPADDDQAVKFAKQESTGTIVWDAAAGRPETSVLSYEVEIEQSGRSDTQLKLEQSTEFRRIADESQ